MFRFLLLLFSFSQSFVSIAQNSSIEIGELNNGVNQLNNLQTPLTKAFEWTFKDGTKINDLKIEQLSSNYYLVAYCTYQGHKRMAAVDLELIGLKFTLPENANFKLCSAVACENCRFFLESNKIIACKCEETGTISNHCHYKSSTALAFISNLKRAIKMTEKGE